MENCEHKNQITDHERGEVICRECGLVLDQEFVFPTFLMGKDRNLEKCAKPQAFSSLGERDNIVNGLGSHIGGVYGAPRHDIKNHTISAENRAKFTRLKNYDERAKLGGKETTYRTLCSFNRICSTLHIPPTISNRACQLYKKLKDQLLKSDRINSVNLMACCLYLAVKEVKYPLPLKALATAFSELNHRVSMKSIVRTALMLKIRFNTYFQNESIRSEDYLNTIISAIMNSKEVCDRINRTSLTPHNFAKLLYEQANSLLSRIPLDKRGGKNPYLFAVASIYAVGTQIGKQFKAYAIITQTLLAQVTNSAEYTIRDHWLFFQQYL
jgi:transcription initiation factor TFIIB